MLSGETIEHWTRRAIRNWGSFDPETLKDGFTALGILVDGALDKGGLVSDIVVASLQKGKAPLSEEVWTDRCAQREQASTRMARFLQRPKELLLAYWGTVSISSRRSLVVLPRKPWGTASIKVLDVIGIYQRQNILQIPDLIPTTIVGPGIFLESLKDAPALWKSVRQSRGFSWPEYLHQPGLVELLRF